MPALLHRVTVLFLIPFFLAACKKDGAGSNLPTPADTVFFNNTVETTPPVLKPVTRYLNDAIGGFYLGLPALYNQTSKRYPLLVSLHGAGQLGNGALDLPLLLNDGIPQLLDGKTFPANFVINGKNISFIILSPQFSRYPSDAEFQSFIEFAKMNYRVDTTRLYLTGLSLGGIMTTDMASLHAGEFAAIVPISGVITGSDLSAKCMNISRADLPVWAFHNSDDPKINANGTIDFVALINGYDPGVPAKLTLFQSSIHDAWTKAIDPAYKENNMNIYQWMLQYTR